MLDQKRKFFLSPRRRNDAPTASNTPPTGSNPIGAKDSVRNTTTPILENIALRQMKIQALAATFLLKRNRVLRL